MTVACSCLDNGNGGSLYHSLDKLCAAARNEDIYIVVGSHHIMCDAAVGVLYQLYDIGVKSRSLHSGAHQVCQALVGVYCFLAAAKYHSISAFQAEYGRINGNVRTSFVYHSHNAHRNADTLDLHAVGSGAAVNHLTYGIGILCKGFAGISHTLYPCIVQCKSVQQRLGHLPCPAVFEIDRISCHDLLFAAAEDMCDLQQRVVLHVCGSKSNGAFRSLCLLSQCIDITHN